MFRNDEVREQVPHGFFSVMVFDAATRASWGARKAWLQSLDWVQAPRAFRGFEPVFSPENNCELLVSQRGFDLAWNVSVYQLNGMSLVWGLTSSAE